MMFIRITNFNRSSLDRSVMLNGGPVAWKSKLQAIVALSTADAEFVAANYAACEIMFLRQFMEVMGFGQDKPTCLFVDNSAAVYQSRRRSTNALSPTKSRRLVSRITMFYSPRGRENIVGNSYHVTAKGLQHVHHSDNPVDLMILSISYLVLSSISHRTLIDVSSHHALYSLSQASSSDPEGQVTTRDWNLDTTQKGYERSLVARSQNNPMLSVRFWIPSMSHFTSFLNRCAHGFLSNVTSRSTLVARILRNHLPSDLSGYIRLHRISNPWNGDLCIPFFDNCALIFDQM